MINDWQSYENKEDIVGFLQMYLEKELGKGSEDAVTEITNTINTVKEVFNKIRMDKGHGYTIEQSLKKTFVDAKVDISEEDMSRAITGPINKANSDVLKSIEVPAITEKDEQDFSAEIKKSTFLEAQTFDEMFKVDIEVSEEESEKIKEYLNSDMDSPIDSDIKKIAATSLYLEKEKGNKELKDLSAEEIALISDRGLTITKLAYKLGKNDITDDFAIDYLVEHAAATFKVIVKDSLQKFGKATGEYIGAIVGKVFGPKGMIIGAKIGREIGNAGGRLVAEAISKGIEIVAECAKAVIKVVDSVGKAVSKWVNKLFS